MNRANSLQESLNAIFPQYAWVIRWKTDYDAYDVVALHEGEKQFHYLLTGPEMYEKKLWPLDKQAYELGRKIIDQGRIEDKGLAINREA